MKTIEYPDVWPDPKYRYGQQVIVYHGGGTSLMLVVGMRFGVFPDSKRALDGWAWHVVQEWRYQVVDIINGNPGQHCDGRWHKEDAFAGYAPTLGEEQ